MDSLGTVILALLLPVFCGVLFFNLVVQGRVPGRGALVWGHGALLGLFAVTLMMRVVDAAGYGLDDYMIKGYVVRALVVLGVLNLLLRRRVDRAPPTTWTTASRVLFAVLLAMLLARVVALGVEIYSRPLFPWDATMHWSTKARVWFAQGEMVPFVTPSVWLEMAGDGVYTDRHANYPPAIPLLQVWMSLVLDQWNESLINLPWLMAFSAMGLAFFAQLRIAGLGLPLAMAATYILLSMPLINIHVALAGYADMFLGASFACTLMALHNWSVKRERWQGGLMLLFAATCYMIKNEGAIWPMTLVPAIAAAFMARREAAKLFVLFCLLGLFGWLVVPKDMEMAGTTLSQLEPTFNIDAVVGVVTSVLVHGSWHLFGYLMLARRPLG